MLSQPPLLALMVLFVCIPSSLRFELTLFLQINSLVPPGGLLATPVTDPANDPGLNRRTVGIVLVSIGGAIFVLGILILIIAGVILYMKYDELKAIEGAIESLKDLQNNRL